MTWTVDRMLAQVARRGSWYGGGSVAALCVALAAALLEKLIVRRPALRRLHAIRARAASFIEEDARRFARVIQCTRLGHRGRFREALKSATDIPCRIFEDAQVIQAECRRAQRDVKPQFQSDLRCALAVALAGAESARTLIETNLAWLGDDTNATRISKQLRTAGLRRAAASRL
jgi:formiminotetrahydrofolate cyclodeaminase